MTESGHSAGSSDRVEAQQPKERQSKLARFGPAALIAIAALIGLVVWLVVESGGGSSSTSTATPESQRPVALSEAGLKTLAGALRQPVYWVGPQAGRRYEVTQNANRIYVRYLPQGVKAGDSQPHLTIGTYSMVDAYNVTQKGARTAGERVLRIPGGGVAVVSKTSPTSVYVAYPGANAQIEVFHPRAAVARRIAVSGNVKTVLGAAQSGVKGGPVAVSRAGLASLAASLGHPVYWAGPRANVTYELTQTADGRIYVRYLPKGTSVGASGGFLTIATYPMKNAFAITRKTSNGPGAVKLSLPNGGIAVYSGKQLTNIHMAYPGANVQIEVYDPSGKVPQKLVASGLVAPVG